jgi:hypothetical protein
MIVRQNRNFPSARQRMPLVSPFRPCFDDLVYHHVLSGLGSIGEIEARTSPELRFKLMLGKRMDTDGNRNLPRFAHPLMNLPHHSVKHYKILLGFITWAGMQDERTPDGFNRRGVNTVANVLDRRL